jgi:hypothetical protein
MYTHTCTHVLHVHVYNCSYYMCSKFLQTGVNFIFVEQLKKVHVCVLIILLFLLLYMYMWYTYIHVVHQRTQYLECSMTNGEHYLNCFHSLDAAASRLILAFSLLSFANLSFSALSLALCANFTSSSIRDRSASSSICSNSPSR